MRPKAATPTNPTTPLSDRDSWNVKHNCQYHLCPWEWFPWGTRKWMKTSEPIVFCHRTPFKCSSPTFPIGMKVRRLTESPDGMPEGCVQRVSLSIRRRTNHVYSGWSDACCDLCFAFLSFLFYSCCLSELPGWRIVTHFFHKSEWWLLLS